MYNLEDIVSVIAISGKFAKCRVVGKLQPIDKTYQREYLLESMGPNLLEKCDMLGHITSFSGKQVHLVSNIKFEHLLYSRWGYHYLWWAENMISGVAVSTISKAEGSGDNGGFKYL